MMRKTPALVAAGLLVSLVGTAAIVTAEDKPATDKKATTQSTADAKSGAPVNKFCAVQGGDNKVDPDVFVIYKGKKVGFCCKDCIEEFNKDPDKYVKNMK